MDIRGTLHHRHRCGFSYITGVGRTAPNGKALNAKLDPEEKSTFVASGNPQIHKTILSLNTKRNRTSKLPLPSPAALVKTGKTRTLVIADPHLGWEIALQARGIHVPSQTYPSCCRSLWCFCPSTSQLRCCFLGDVKYTIVKTEAGEWHDIPEFFTELKRYVSDIAIVRGNHERYLEPSRPKT